MRESFYEARQKEVTMAMIFPAFAAVSGSLVLFLTVSSAATSPVPSARLLLVSQILFLLYRRPFPAFFNSGVQALAGRYMVQGQMKDPNRLMRLVILAAAGAGLVLTPVILFLPGAVDTPHPAEGEADPGISIVTKSAKDANCSSVPGPNVFSPVL